MSAKPKRLLFFIGSLASGGKERRLIELLTYLKAHSSFDLTLVVTKNIVHYDYFHQLGIPYNVIGKPKRAASIPVSFYKFCRKHRPHLIHTWGRMQTFYALPAVVALRIPLINGQITAAPPRISKLSRDYWIDRLNFFFSKLIVANAYSGILAYHPPAFKSRVVFNGVNPARFQNLPDKQSVLESYGVASGPVVIMAASFSPNKDYDRFLRIAQLVTSKRPTVTFIGVGASAPGCTLYDRIVAANNNHPRILFPGKSDHVEALINACTIGVLFSAKSHGEGISNAIIEYMSLAKPVLANDSGGTREVVKHDVNGYLVSDHSDETVAALLIRLIDDPELCDRMGMEGYKLIQSKFTLSQMGRSFHNIYNEILGVDSEQTSKRSANHLSKVL